MSSRMLRVSLFVCLLGCFLVQPPGVHQVRAQSPPANVIDDSRRVDWSQAGVLGGIPHRATGTCATLDPGASADDINDAIAACSHGVVYLNAGIYELANGLTFSGTSHVTLRGAGPEQTVLKFTQSNPCGGLWANVCIPGSRVWSGNVPSGNIRNWTSGYAKGTTQITIDSSEAVTVGMVIVLDQLDDLEDYGGMIVSDIIGKFSFEGGAPGRRDRAQQQFVQVTAIDGNRLTISPGLYMPNWRESQQPQVWWWGETASMNGIEDLTLDHSESVALSGTGFNNAYNGWMKNVKSFNAPRNHVWINQAARIEVRDSYFYGTKHQYAQSYGVESFTSSDNLVVNNIFHRVTSPLMLGPSSGSVFAYNFMTDMAYYIPTWMMAGIVGGHDAGTGMNLFEGNVANQFAMDLYHGTGGFATLFRNRFTGTEPGKVQWGNTTPVSIWAFNRFINIVGNVLGTAGYHGVYEDSSAPTSIRGWPERSIYVLGFSGSGEYDWLGNDPLVMDTMLRWGNYDYATNETQWNLHEIPPGHSVPLTQSLPASLFLSGIPDWWGSTPWPAIGPDVVGGHDPAGHAHKIPAQICYENSARNADERLIFDANLCYATGSPR